MARTSAALNVGVTPVEVREAVYECAPFIGFPATLNAMATVNDVCRDRGIELPLPSQATVGEDDRYDQGRAIQFPIYGDEIRDDLAALPDGLGDELATPRQITALIHCFPYIGFPAPSTPSASSRFRRAVVCESWS